MVLVKNKNMHIEHRNIQVSQIFSFVLTLQSYGMKEAVCNSCENSFRIYLKC